MGCDYYIIKILEITHFKQDKKIISKIELNRERCYFPYENSSEDDKDSDDTQLSYNSYFEKKYSKYLQVTYQPRTLFENDKWKNTEIQEKYENLIKHQIGHDKIISIIKKEVRCLR